MVSIEQRTVKIIEDELLSAPDDIELKKELTFAIFDRYLYGQGNLPAKNKFDLQRLRELFIQLPDDVALIPRAYVAHLDHREDEALSLLAKAYLHPTQKGEIQAVTSDEVWFLAEIFDDPPKGFWLTLADALEQLWPESAAVFTLKGLEVLDQQDDPHEALDHFVRALGADKNYWWAAWLCANIYYDDKNWRAARGYYYKALSSESAQQVPEVHFDLAWCLGQLKEYQGEEQHYRSCLEIDPDHEFARNNLGWSLLKQDRNEEALKVFEEAIARGNDGIYPLYNKARALAKLGRYSEAIVAWQATARRGKLSKFAKEQISRLQKILEKQELGQSVETQVNANEADNAWPEESAEATSSKEAAEDLTSAIPSRSSLRKMAVPKEQWLEEMIEQQIQQGKHVFNRQLRIFDPPEGPYGRQYAIPGIGRIDLLTEDMNTNDWVVIELKRDESHDKVVGQISLYMSWVRENLATQNQKVVGVICGFNMSDKLRLAAKSVQELEVFDYDLSTRKVA